MSAESLFELALLPIVMYFISLPLAGIVYLLVRKSIIGEANFWKLSVGNFLGGGVAFFCYVLAIGGDAGKPEQSITVAYALIGALGYVATYWGTARLLKIQVGIKRLIIPFAIMAYFLLTFALYG